MRQGQGRGRASAPTMQCKQGEPWALHMAAAADGHRCTAASAEAQCGAPLLVGTGVQVVDRVQVHVLCVPAGKGDGKQGPQPLAAALRRTVEENGERLWVHGVRVPICEGKDLVEEARC